MSEIQISKEMIERFYDLHQMKKEIESEMNDLKENFHTYFDHEVGLNKKGEITEGRFKLQRQIRRTEKYHEKDTVDRLEELNMSDLIKVVRKPDDSKIKGAIQLGLLSEDDLKGCKVISYSKAISVKEE
ncbi:hypothetical protein D8M04_07080 [Oceanobacillus piezotolerans]|uniref:Uncharacterized protein n=1 Tax=Oceanobacillus piezotolerans TaxID=2448030 RepID=A0A498D969_9BACI|nr:hypothetical protein [Oceanobacillus piezotolerans]RLL46953.1 hypothetical protein D8M04_07080 [Oceanobacillus piezotolerans]